MSHYFIDFTVKEQMQREALEDGVDEDIGYPVVFGDGPGIASNELVALFESEMDAEEYADWRNSREGLGDYNDPIYDEETGEEIVHSVDSVDFEDL